MCNTRYEDTIREFAQILSRRDAVERRRETLAANSPDRFPIDLPSLPEPASLTDATAMSDKLDAVETWLDIYEAYASQYDAIDQAVEGGVRHQAATGTDAQIETVVSTLAEQLHPRHYEDPDLASEAVDALTVVLDGYEHGYVTDTDEFDDRTLLETAGPDEQQLSAIAALFEPVQTV